MICPFNKIFKTLQLQICRKYKVYKSKTGVILMGYKLLLLHITGKLKVLFVQRIFVLFDIFFGCAFLTSSLIQKIKLVPSEVIASVKSMFLTFFSYNFIFHNIQAKLSFSRAQYEGLKAQI